MYTDFKKLAQKFGADKLKIMELFALLLVLLNKADQLLLVLHKSVLTEDLKAADGERKSIFKGLGNVVKGYVDLPTPAKKEAARRLHNLLSQYKLYGVKGSYVEESSGIYNLLQDLKGAYAADVTLLGLSEWVVALRQAEDLFIDIRTRRAQEDINKPQESLIDVRVQADRLYSGIVNVLEAKLLADGLGGDVVVNPGDLDTGIWEDGDPTPPEQRGNIVYNFVIAWNVYVQKYHNLLAARAGRRAGKKQPDAPDPESPGEETPDVPPQENPEEDID
jgi:hypothetical protein